jgi:protoporphyrinogen oxidase
MTGGAAVEGLGGELRFNMSVVVLGAGPAGLAATYVLARGGGAPVLLEKAPGVGGISRTVTYRGFHFDLGGHRFFTKFDEVQALWEEVLGDAFLVRPRLSRIFYDGKFYDYPLRATNALRNLGPVESARCMASYARARLRTRGGEESFEEWVSNRFGDRLFDIFFRSYTEKVWGIPVSEIGAEWASQRIKNLSLAGAVKDALLRPIGRRGPVVTSLIEQFHYPRTGPGLMYDTMSAKASALGADVRLREEAVRIERRGFRIQRVISRTPDGTEHVHAGDHFLSSIPVTHLIRGLSPQAPDEVLEAANALRFRNLLTIDLIVDHPDLFPDNWIYVHDSRLQLGRVQNFKNWSPHMVPDATKTSLGLEYFCFDEDPIWKMSVPELVALGTREMEATGLLRGARVVDGTAVWVPRAYPVYARGYERHLEVIVAYLRQFENLQTVGRYGMFKYNNADHSILTALLAVENIQGAKHDIWAVNTDTEYHEVRRG